MIISGLLIQVNMASGFLRTLGHYINFNNHESVFQLTFAGCTVMITGLTLVLTNPWVVWTDAVVGKLWCLVLEINWPWSVTDENNFTVWLWVEGRGFCSVDVWITLELIITDDFAGDNCGCNSEDNDLIDGVTEDFSDDVGGNDNADDGSNVEYPEANEELADWDALSKNK